MTILQEFGSWWFHNVFQPYLRFVYVENLEWAMIVVAVVTTILLGLFYERSKSMHNRFMEHYGFPLILIALALALAHDIKRMALAVQRGEL